MVDNKKAAPGIRAASKNTLSDSHYNFRSVAKTLIVWCGLWGLLPIAAGEWLLKQGGLRHE